jgi:hypothetical protein
MTAGNQSTSQPRRVESTLATGLLRQSLRAGQAVTIRTHGRSMWPILQDGDMLQVEPCELAEVQVGDILVCERSADLVVHRLIEPVAATLLTKGDAMLFPDPAHQPGALLGRVVAITRQGRERRFDRGWRQGAGPWLARFSALVGALSLAGYRVYRWFG